MQTIRTMQSSDLSDVLRIEALSFSKPWPEEAFISSQLTDSYVICEEFVLIGYIIFHNVLDESMIINFAIDPAYQKKGFGTTLLQHTLELMIGRKFTSFYLDVRASNFTAQSLYRKFGFQRLAIRKDYYTQPDEDAIVMVKHIVEV